MADKKVYIPPEKLQVVHSEKYKRRSASSIDDRKKHGYIEDSPLNHSHDFERFISEVEGKFAQLQKNKLFKNSGQSTPKLNSNKSYFGEKVLNDSPDYVKINRNDLNDTCKSDDFDFIPVENSFQEIRFKRKHETETPPKYKSSKLTEKVEEIHNTEFERKLDKILFQTSSDNSGNISISVNVSDNKKYDFASTQEFTNTAIQNNFQPSRNKYKKQFCEIGKKNYPNLYKQCTNNKNQNIILGDQSDTENSCNRKKTNVDTFKNNLQRHKTQSDLHADDSTGNMSSGFFNIQDDNKDLSQNFINTEIQENENLNSNKNRKEFFNTKKRNDLRFVYDNKATKIKNKLLTDHPHQEGSTQKNLIHNSTKLNEIQNINGSIDNKQCNTEEKDKEEIIEINETEIEDDTSFIIIDETTDETSSKFLNSKNFSAQEFINTEVLNSSEINNNITKEEIIQTNNNSVSMNDIDNRKVKNSNNRTEKNNDESNNIEEENIELDEAETVSDDSKYTELDNSNSIPTTNSSETTTIEVLEEENSNNWSIISQSFDDSIIENLKTIFETTKHLEEKYLENNVKLLEEISTSSESEGSIIKDILEYTNNFNGKHIADLENSIKLLEESIGEHMNLINEIDCHLSPSIKLIRNKFTVNTKEVLNESYEITRTPIKNKKSYSKTIIKRKLFTPNTKLANNKTYCVRHTSKSFLKINDAEEDDLKIHKKIIMFVSFAVNLFFYNRF